MKFVRIVAAVCALALAFSPAPARGDATTFNQAATSSSNITLLSAVAATGAGTAWSNLSGFTAHKLTVTTTGSPTYTVSLEGSYNNSNWITLAKSSASSATTPAFFQAQGYYPYLRANLTVLSGGTLTANYSGAVLESATFGQFPPANPALTPGQMAPPSIDAAARLQAGNSGRSTYKTSVTVTVPTSAAAIFAIESDATNVTRLRYMKICLGPTALQTTAGVRQIFLFRTTAASTGGTARTPLIADATGTVPDAAFGGIVNTGAITTTPSGPTQVANAIHTFTLSFTAANPTAIVCSEAKQFDLGGDKPPTAAAGVANGLALFDITGGAGGAGNYVIDASFTAEAN